MTMSGTKLQGETQTWLGRPGLVLLVRSSYHLRHYCVLTETRDHGCESRPPGLGACSLEMMERLRMGEEQARPSGGGEDVRSRIQQ
jgi:hypothetical protein